MLEENTLEVGEPSQVLHFPQVFRHIHTMVQIISETLCEKEMFMVQMYCESEPAMISSTIIFLEVTTMGFLMPQQILGQILLIILQGCFQM